VIFFFDENMPESAARLIGVFDRKHEVRHLLDRFPRATPDVEWIRTVASWAGNPVAVCADGRILRNEVEKKVLRECGLMFVYMASGWTNTEWPVYAWKIVKVWPDVVRSVEQARFPIVLEVTLGLKVRTYGRIDSL
jgi:hypothetical protein